MRRPFFVSFAVTVLACAGGQSASGSTGTPVDRQKVVNLVPYDLANCFPAKMDLGKTANEYTLPAAFRAAQPAIGECLVDGRVQNPNAPTKAKVSISLDGSGTTVGVNGAGLQPAAQSCIENALRAQLAGVTAAPGSKPLTLEAPVERDLNGMVRFGINESSDVVGTIRLALPQWCTCFEPIRTQAPPELTGSVTVVRAEVAKYADRLKLPDGGVPSNKPVTSSLQSPDPAGAQVASCVNGRIESLPLKTNSDQLNVPVQLALVNAGSAQAYSAAAVPTVQFVQMDAVRERRQAEALAALTRRQNVANSYDALVQAYQAAASSKDAKKRKTAGALVKDLKATCAALIKADDEYTRALEGEAGIEQQAVQLAQALRAKDPQWADAEKASTEALAGTQKEIVASKQLRTSNEKACPKEKY